MRKLTRLLPLLLICSIHLLAPEVRADDPVVITKGSLSGRFINYNFRIEGGNFALAGFSEDGAVRAATCAPCRPGSVISGDGVFASIFGSGEVRINGVTHPTVYHEGDFSFRTESIELPPVPSDLVVKMPFTFTGVYRAYNTPGRNVAPIFQTDLRGQGVATIKFRVTPFFLGSFHYEYENITYDFAPKAILREPVVIREPWWQRFKLRMLRKR